MIFLNKVSTLSWYFSFLFVVLLNCQLNKHLKKGLALLVAFYPVRGFVRRFFFFTTVTTTNRRPHDEEEEE